MKMFAVTVVIGLSVSAAGVFAASERPAGASRPAAGKPFDQAKALRMLMERISREFKLAPDARRQLEQAFQSYNQALANWRQEHAAQLKQLGEQIKAARESKDEDAVMTAREELAKLTESRKTLRENFEKQLADILTPEQMARVKDILNETAQPVMRFVAAMATLDMTDDQKVASRKILENARQEAENVNEPREKNNLYRAAVEKIRKEVLTPPQCRKLDAMKEADRFNFNRIERLNLTDEQRASIRQIMGQAHDQAVALETPQQRRDVYQAAFEKIRTTILTEEQRQQLERLPKPRPRGDNPKMTASNPAGGKA